MKKLSKNRLALIASLDLGSIPFLKVVDIWTKYETDLLSSVKLEGKLHTLEKYKACYIFLRNKLLHLPNSPVPFCKVDRVGIPKPLWSLRPLLKKDRDIQRLALSIARSYEQITLPINYKDTDDITRTMDPEKVPQYEITHDVFCDFLTRFCHENPWYLGSLQKPSEPYTNVPRTLRNGPNGPAVFSSHKDARAVLDNPPLWDAITGLNVSLGQTWITEWMQTQAEKVKSDISYVTGRLGFSAEPAGKTRKFAMADYWSQLSLRTLQEDLYSVLKTYSTDATSDQDKGFKTLMSESLEHPTYCFDLSSASDRIPAEMQKHRLRLMKGSDLADSWFRVMTDRDFYIKTTKTSVRWSTGQPLGLLSSFPSFALWHHDIIQLAANWENFHNGKPLRFFKQYRLLGDDVVIFNKEVAVRYQWLLLRLDIKINLKKSVIGYKRNSQIEFAKRLALNGKEYSSIKHNILSSSKMHCMLDLVEILRLRDFTLPDTGHIGLHRILQTSDLLHLRFLLWIRSSDEPIFWIKPENGNSSVKIDRELVTKKVNNKRVHKLLRKVSNPTQMDLGVLPPEIYSETEFAFGSGYEMNLGYMGNTLAGVHPVLLALSQTTDLIQETIWDLMQGLNPDEVSPVEYLPNIDAKSYFTNRKTVNEYLSTLLLECFHEILKEENLKKENTLPQD